jgi:hypothetical protein
MSDGGPLAAPDQRTGDRAALGHFVYTGIERPDYTANALHIIHHEPNIMLFPVVLAWVVVWYLARTPRATPAAVS